jgi:hypothetical protein
MKYRIRNLIAVFALAVAGGWAAASGLYAWGFPEISTSGKSWLESVRQNSEFIFFPPLFGDSLIAYFGVCISITIAAFVAVIWMKRNETENQRRKK